MTFAAPQLRRTIGSVTAASTWDIVSSIATGASALVTMGTVVFIARQTAATNKTADAAVQALTVAREQTDLSRFLAIEAVKTRIDAGMPTLRLSLGPAAWPPLEASDYGDPQPVVATTPFRLPRDGHRRLILRVPVDIFNEGDVAADLRSNFTVWENGRARELGEFTLAPGENWRGLWVDVNRSVAEWVDVWKRRDETRASVDPAVFDVTFLDPRDTGAFEVHQLEVDGTLVRPVPQEDGAWTIIDAPGPTGEVGSIGASLRPRTRKYWLSRSAGIELPAMTLRDGDGQE